MKIYIAGKITDYPQYKTRFAKAEAMLKESWGAVVLSPHRLPKGLDWSEYMHICYSMIDVSECVFFLNNWQDSKGARKEFAYAKKNHKKIMYEGE